MYGDATVTPWTATEDTQLRQLWDMGLPTAEIGRRLNRSKNSIIGRAHRLGLKQRPSPISTKVTLTPAGRAAAQ